ncbi:MAG: FkbM family methyltransferase [Eubacteriales bacterium]|nr:FkbM family methyltransferase [Eubacteriales bacterium]
MLNTSEPFTRQAVEAALLQGLNQLEPIDPQKPVFHGSICELPDNTLKSKVKLRLKKNRLIYGCWLRYKALRARRASRASFKTRVKFRLKNNRLVRFLINKKKEPGLVREDHELLLQLLQIATINSQKCDATSILLSTVANVTNINSEKCDELTLLADKLIGQADELLANTGFLTEHVQQVSDVREQLTEHYRQSAIALDALQQQHDNLSSVLHQLQELVKQDKAGNGERLDKLTSVQNQLNGLSNTLQQADIRVGERLDKLTSVQNQLNGLSNTLQQADIHVGERLDKLNHMQEQLDGLTGALQQTNINANADQNTALTILTGAHEKLDALSLGMQQLAGDQRRCHTAVSGSDAICIQYDWDILLAVPKSDWRLAMYLSTGGHFEYGTEKLFRETVHEGMVVLDIGANVGVYTLHALKQQAEVYAFEPTPLTYSILRLNTEMNGFEFSHKVHLFNVAASNKYGVANFQEVEYTCGHNSLYEQETGFHRIEVSTDLIDHLVGNIKVDCFKLDVEGAEMIALEGMEQLLQANTSIIGFVEFAPGNLRRASVEPEVYYNKLLAYGFLDMQVINEADGSLTPVASYEQIQHVDSVNLLLKKRS